MLTGVRVGEEMRVTYGEGGSDPPICMVMEPPLLPVKTASDPFVIVTMEPKGASISKMDWKYRVARFNATTLPVTDRVPVFDILIVPPEIPLVKAPKLRFCTGYTLSLIHI